MPIVHVSKTMDHHGVNQFCQFCGQFAEKSEWIYYNPNDQRDRVDHPVCKSCRAALGR